VVVAVATREEGLLAVAPVPVALRADPDAASGFWKMPYFPL
jgi:hypothetical protein